MKLMMEQKQMLKMVMTTELRQAIEILQLSTYELLQFVEEKAAENPFIELVEKEEETAANYKNVRKQTYSNEYDPLANAAKKEMSMHDHLLDQILHMRIQEELDIVRYLILNVNNNGFVPISNKEVAVQLNVSEQLVSHAREIVMNLEPCGIGAKGMTDCLLIQAKKNHPHDDLLITVIEDHLQALADKQWSQIAKQLNVSLHDIQDVFQSIQTLNPRPGMLYETTKVEYVQPDITIEFDENRDIHTIQLHEHYIPNLHFNHEYSTQMKASGELAQYVQHQYKQYEWLQKSILQRRNTILKIMDVIVRHQYRFLLKGFRHLKPLTLKEVADEIGMHESTVSRATTNKMIQTPVGIFELRNLFSTKITSNNGADNSQTEVKEIIKELVDQEDKYKPLSDQKLADVLKAHYDIAISRRTVAKYRDELFILSSSKRKNIKIKV